MVGTASQVQVLTAVTYTYVWVKNFSLCELHTAQGCKDCIARDLPLPSSLRARVTPA